MCKAAPEQAAVRQSLDVGQDARAGRRKTGDGFEKRVGKSGNFAVNYKRQTAEDTERNPRKRNGDKAFFQVKTMFLGRRRIAGTPAAAQISAVVRKAYAAHSR